MANRKLFWVFELNDRISGPSKRASRALGEVGSGLEKVARAAGRAERGGESLGTRLHSLVSLGEKAFRLAEGVGHVGLSFAEAAVEAASFKEETVVGLSTVLGSADKASRVLHQTVALAAHLPIETQDAISATTKLAMAGFKGPELSRLTIAAADVKALNPGRGDEAMRYFVRHIDEVQQVGLQHRHLRFLSQEANLPEERVLHHLSQLYGGADEKTLKKAMAQGLIDKHAAITAILQTVAEKEGGKLGTLSKKLSATVPGLLSTLKSRKLELLMDLDESPAYGSFRGFLANLTSALDPSSRFGRQVKESIARTFGGVFSRLFGDFSGPDGAQRLEKVLARVLHTLDLVGVGFQAAAGLGKGFIGELANGLGISDDLFGKDGSLDEKKIQKLVERFEDLGKQVGDVVLHILQLTQAVAELIPSSEVATHKGLPGIFELTFDKEGRWSGVDILKSPEANALARQQQALGRASAQGYALGLGTDVSPVTAVRRMGQDASQAMAKALDAHSPSRVFARYGRYSAEGYRLGIDQAAPAATRTVDALVRPSRGPATPAAGSGASPTQIQVTLELHFDGSQAGVARVVVDRLEAELPRVLAEAAAKLRAREPR